MKTNFEWAKVLPMGKNVRFDYDHVVRDTSPSAFKSLHPLDFPCTYLFDVALLQLQRRHCGKAQQNEAISLLNDEAPR